MKINVSVQLNLNTLAVAEKVRKAASQALKDTAIDIAHDVVRLSPKLTGDNARSIDYKIKELEAEIFSTSGYGGYLEVGTRAHGPATKPMLVWEGPDGKLIFAHWVRGIPARPYFKPALDSNFSQEKFAEKVRGKLEI